MGTLSTLERSEKKKAPLPKRKMQKGRQSTLSTPGVFGQILCLEILKELGAPAFRSSAEDCPRGAGEI